MNKPVDEVRFDFGKNWASYSRHIDRERIHEAKVRLHSLLEPIKLEHKRFLDIGCGSGLHSLAALELGASEVMAFDVDAGCAETTRNLLAKMAGDKPYYVQKRRA